MNDRLKHKLLVWGEIIFLVAFSILFASVAYNWCVPVSWRFFSSEVMDFFRPWLEVIGFMAGVIWVKCLRDEGVLK